MTTVYSFRVLNHHKANTLLTLAHVGICCAQNTSQNIAIIKKTYSLQVSVGQPKAYALTDKQP